jgi:hypothetical protein
MSHSEDGVRGGALKVVARFFSLTPALQALFTTEACAKVR